MEVETDKVTVEIEAPTDGLLAGLRAAEGADVPVGEAVAVHPGARRGAAGERIVPGARAGACGGGTRGRRDRRRLPGATRVAASPRRRRAAWPPSRGSTWTRSETGSGPGGAVVAADILASPAPALRPATVQGGSQPLSRIWSIMAERTTQSWTSAPHFYLLREVDAGRLASWRAVRPRPARARTSASPTCSCARPPRPCARHPQANAAWDDGSIRLNDEVNVGIAVAVEDGLVVPVVHGADRLGLGEIAARREDVVSRAREGALRPDDLERGTFTISNLGMYGVDAFNAVVNAPQAAILAVGRIVERVVPVGRQPGRAADDGAHALLRPPCHRRRPRGAVSVRARRPDRGARRPCGLGAPMSTTERLRATDLEARSPRRRGSGRARRARRARRRADGALGRRDRGPEPVRRRASSPSSTAPGPPRSRRRSPGPCGRSRTTRRLPVLAPRRDARRASPTRSPSGATSSRGRSRSRQASRSRPRASRPSAPRSPSASPPRRRSGSTARSCRSTGCPGTEGRTAHVRRVPLGPIAGITPFNFPLNLVVAQGRAGARRRQPDRAAARVADAGERAAARRDRARGRLARGRDRRRAVARTDDAAPLVEDDRIKLLTFTGSPAVGWALKAAPAASA